MPKLVSEEELMRLIAEDKYSKVEELCQEAIQGGDASETYYSLLGVAYFNQDKYEEAVITFKEAISLNPEKATYYHYLGATYGMQGNHVKAEEAYRNAIIRRPTSALFHHNLGRALSEQGKDIEAALEFQKAEALPPVPGYDATTLGENKSTSEEAREATGGWRETLRSQSGRGGGEEWSRG
jgi:tetratricopeptide (TPR) repeat protein